MNVEDFKIELMLLLDIAPESRLLRYVTTILDMLQEAALVQVADNSVTLVSAHWSEASGLKADGDRLSVGTAVTGGPSQPETLAIGVSESIRIQDSVRVSAAPARAGTEVPLALGPGRLVYVFLPSDWDVKRDLRKFLKLAELALGEELPE